MGSQQRKLLSGFLDCVPLSLMKGLSPLPHLGRSETLKLQVL